MTSNFILPSLMKLKNGKVVFKGLLFENPLNDATYPKRSYKEWKETQKTSYRTIWIDRYIYEKNDAPCAFESCELKISNRNKVFLDDVELKDADDIANAIEIFSNLKVK